jgi:hypothetical protein
VGIDASETVLLRLIKIVWDAGFAAHPDKADQS